MPWIKFVKPVFAQGVFILYFLLCGNPLFGEEQETQMDAGVEKVEHDNNSFRPGPSYEGHTYDEAEAEAQIKIYHGKKKVKTMRPLLELGYPFYAKGSYEPGGDLFGRKNPTRAQLVVFGDWRTTLAHNDNANNGGGNQTIVQDVIATQLTLEIDYRITAKERFHITIKPFNKDGDSTSFIINQESGNQTADTEAEGYQDEFDLEADAFFFEGDLAGILAGFQDDHYRADIPFAFGLIPMFMQNGIWLNDAFYGFAVGFPAMNSRSLDISNFDITLFAGFEEVTTAAFKDEESSNTKIYGIAAFIEANEGYWETGYGYVNTDLIDLSYHNVTVAFTRRYGNLFSNSIRVIGNFGQNPEDINLKTAEGALVLLENSLISSSPLTLVPYLNLFSGTGNPQPLANGAGSLKNTGINFETDGITGFPKLDDTGQDARGGALGVEYLFNLDQQIVVEVAWQSRDEKDDQGAFGIRHQIPLNHAWIFRTDAIIGRADNETQIAGIRFETRLKF